MSLETTHVDLPEPHSYLRSSASPPVKNILFVCTGNICRSPMAEGLLRETRLKIGPESLSVPAEFRSRRTATELAVGRSVARRGVDISAQRRPAPHRQRVAESTHIFVMTHNHLELCDVFSGSFRQNFFSSAILAARPLEIYPDPIGPRFSPPIWNAGCAEKGVSGILRLSLPPGPRILRLRSAQRVLHP